MFSDETKLTSYEIKHTENESTKMKRSSSTCRLIASAGILELYQSIFCRSRVKFLISTVRKPKLFNPQIFVIRKKYCHFLLGFLLPPVLCKVFSPSFMIWHPLQHLSNPSNVTSTASPIFSRYWSLFNFNSS